MEYAIIVKGYPSAADNAAANALASHTGGPVVMLHDTGRDGPSGARLYARGCRCWPGHAAPTPPADNSRALLEERMAEAYADTLAAAMGRPDLSR
jgi:hypothetical protein